MSILNLETLKVSKSGSKGYYKDYVWELSQQKRKTFSIEKQVLCQKFQFSIYQFGNSKSVKGWFKGILQRWCSRIVTAKRKNFFYREAIFHSTFFFYPFLFLQYHFGWEFQFELETKVFVYCSAFGGHSDLFLRIPSKKVNHF